MAVTFYAVNCSKLQLFKWLITHVIYNAFLFMKKQEKNFCSSNFQQNIMVVNGSKNRNLVPNSQFFQKVPICLDFWNTGEILTCLALWILKNRSFGSKVTHFCSIFSFRMLKPRKCSEFVLNFVSFGAFYYEKRLTFRKCSELDPNLTLLELST